LVLPADIAFFILKKKDQQPAYQLISLLDDLHFGVDLIVRGQDLYSSSLAQLALAEKLSKPEFQDITFFHHPILKGPKKKKLSKSDGSTSIKSMRDSGKKPRDVYQILGEYLGNLEIMDFESFKAQFLIA
jgi:glutamyl-tRNA synthetase